MLKQPSFQGEDRNDPSLFVNKLTCLANSNFKHSFWMASFALRRVVVPVQNRYFSTGATGNDCKKLLFILNDPPYGNERAYNALRLAVAVVNKPDTHVRVFLMADATNCAKKGQKTPDGYYNIASMLSKVTKKGEVGLCGTCMEARGIQEFECIDGVKRSSLSELADWTLDAQKVIVF